MKERGEQLAGGFRRGGVGERVQDGIEIGLVRIGQHIAGGEQFDLIADHLAGQSEKPVDAVRAAVIDEGRFLGVGLDGRRGVPLG